MISIYKIDYIRKIYKLIFIYIYIYVYKYLYVYIYFFYIHIYKKNMDTSIGISGPRIHRVKLRAAVALHTWGCRFPAFRSFHLNLYFRNKYIIFFE